MPKPSHPSARLFAAVLAAVRSPAAPARLGQLKQATGSRAASPNVTATNARLSVPQGYLGRVLVVHAELLPGEEIAVSYHARAVGLLTSKGAHGSLEPVSTR